MFGLKKSEKTTPPAPSWFKWLMLGFFAFAFLNHMASRQGPTPAEKEIANTTAQVAEGVALVKDQLFPTLVQGVEHQDTKTGSGDAALCGQDVDVTYKITRQDGTVIEDVTEPKTLHLGGGEVLPALSQGIPGMKPGGERVVFAAARYAYDARGFVRSDVPPGAPVKIVVALKQVAPPAPKPAMAVRAFQTAGGVGRPPGCGETVKIALTLWDAAGKKLYESTDAKPFIAPLNGETLPAGLEEALLTAAPGGRGTVILPWELTAPLRVGVKNAKTSPISVVWPARQAVIADFYVIP